MNVQKQGSGRGKHQAWVIAHEELLAFARQHPSIVLANWYTTIQNRMYLLWPDHIHPEIPGT